MRPGNLNPFKITLVILIGFGLIALQLVQGSPVLTVVLALGLSLVGLGIFVNWLLRRLHGD